MAEPVIETEAEVEDPPPRQPWEEPPEGGWSSQLSGVGLETLWLFGAVAVVLLAARLIQLARKWGAEPAADGYHRALVVSMWAGACILVASAAVYVWRRMGGFALLAAMMTDYGRVARLGGRPPVFMDTPPDDRLTIAHLSDLHVTEGPRVRIVERAEPGGNVTLGRLLETPEVEDADVILVTGDVTDRGTAVAWRAFLDAVADRDLTDRVVLVPGNHDLSIVEKIDRGRLRRAFRADRFGVVQLANLLKFCEAFLETGGGRSGFVLTEKGDDVEPFEDAWRRAERLVRPIIAELPGKPAPQLVFGRGFWASRRRVRAYQRRIDEARDTLLALFPIAVKVPARDAVVLVLNSCTAISRHPVTNALGHVGRAQYRRLERLARFFAQRTKIVALHHHVVRRFEERGRSFVSRVMAKFTVLGDAHPLVRFCRAHGVRAVVNGHRHLSYGLRLPNGTVLMAAPSSTLGDELADDPRPQFPYYAFAPEPDAHTVGIYRRIVRLPL